MVRNARVLGLFFIAGVLVFSQAVSAQSDLGDGEGVVSQTLWVSPGPSNFATVQSSDIVGHLGVSFGAMLQHYRKPLGLNVGGEEEWVVARATTTDFTWAFGIADYLQLGVVVPVVLEQQGVGAMPFYSSASGANQASYQLAGSAIGDLRFHVKGRFLGGKADKPDRRDLGLAIDIAMTVPVGDELNFAGENGMVFAPLAVVDFHRCKFSAAVNLGARFRTESAKLADQEIGHQLTAGLGLTGHYLDRRLLISGEGTFLGDLAGLDRQGFEYRGAVGVVPDDAGAVTVWISGGSSVALGDMVGMPVVRLLLGLTYAPARED